jgi:hypothetical protein
LRRNAASAEWQSILFAEAAELTLAVCTAHIAES